MPIENDDPRKYFLDGIDEENVTQEIWKSLNTLYSRISHLLNYKYHLLIYRLAKKDNIKMGDIEDATGYTRQRIHQIINAFEEREVERINRNNEENNSIPTP